MRNRRKLSITAWVLAFCTSLPCLAQKHTTEQGVVVYEEPVTLVSLDKISLADRLKAPKSGLRDVDFGGQFRMRYHRERNLRNSPTVPNSRGLTGASDDF